MKKERRIAVVKSAIRLSFLHSFAILATSSLAHANTYATANLEPLAVSAASFYSSNPQEMTITGTVVGKDNQPVIGAAIQVKGTSRGVIADEKGAFSIKAKVNDVLMISSIGYAAQEVTVVAGKTTYNIVLDNSNSTLDEVVVTGYSSQKVKDLTGAVAVVSVDQMKRQPVASPTEALQGKATGVQIVTDGAPGATPIIRIRGYSTINNNDPLYVIDGVPYEGKLSWLNSADIETMQILKDASAASIYGSRANNGVVIITTKRGKPGQARVNLDMYYGSQNPVRSRFPDMMNPTQYANYLFDAFRNTGDPAKAPGQEATTGTNYGLDPNNPTLPEYLLAGSATGQNVTAADADPSKYNYTPKNSQTFYQITKANQKGTNWFDEMTQNAPIQSYQLGINGGDENAVYSISGGYFDQEGIAKYTGYSRYNIRSNTRFSFWNNRFRIGENMTYSYEEFYGSGVNNNTPGDYIGEGSPFGFAYRIPTIIPVYDIMGNFAGSKGDKLGNGQNPVAMLYRAKDNKNTRNFFFGNAYAELDIIDGLTARTSFGMRYENYGGVSFTYPNLEFSEGGTQDGMSEYQGYNKEWTWTNTLNYKYEKGDHSLNILGGIEAINQKSRYLSAGRNGYFILGNLDYYYLDAGSGNISNTSNGGVSSLFSVFGKVDYSFMDRYLVSATLRRDGSSNFGPENKYANFPAASVAWRISKESFMQDVSWLTDLKLRAGYGITGNQRIPNFQYLRRHQTTIARANYPIVDGKALSSGFWVSDYDNPAIKWEQLKSTNIGLDFTIANGSFDGTLDWYNRKTTDMLFKVPLPAAAVGMGNSPYQNVGTMKNTGFEIALNYHYGFADNKAFQFDLGANFSRNINTVEALAPSVTQQTYGNFRSLTTTILKPGSPFGAFYGYQTAGIYQNADDVANSPSYEGARVGGLKYKDISGPDGKPDGVITPDDRTVIGSPHPDFLYSLNINARYKNFDLSMFFNGVQGNQIFEATRYYTDFGSFDGAASTRMLKAFSATNPSNTTPAPIRTSNDYEYASSSYYIQDGSYLRLKNIQIGYTFPTEKWLGGRIKNLRAYFTATNVFTITNYTGIDPEVTQTPSDYPALGVDFGVYPLSRQFLFGISAGF
ncbi:SusC/RagA family TonB-linked outer membrane protein [Chitinophaga caeni]|uniref:SusC/RagA family TonB-linked outer membrane protein n=1 Tax=Chitinophaga caeni TaxID=2029983 RepID=A0A291QXB3_9BACT|nr:TonB-dependent receptor [Chitinophaga caeni]ATL48503.1 SusC/RagA family TonB-linked outer membrane protein [Chitinophaga caeni]